MLPQPFCKADVMVSLENSSVATALFGKGGCAATASPFMRAWTAVAALSGRWFGRRRRDGSERSQGQERGVDLEREVRHVL